ncbi:hypothetical protein K432DRAFT_430279, partial [Lepidopterella palustris CBS 459.81]
MSNAGTKTTLDPPPPLTPDPALLAEKPAPNPIAPAADQGHSRSGGKGNTLKPSYDKILVFNEEWTRKLAALRLEKADLETELSKAKKDAQCWNNKAAKLEKEYELLYTNYLNVCREQDRQAETVRRVQENAFRYFDSAEWMPESNEEIEQKLKTLDSDVKKWSKEYAITSLGIIPLCSNKREILMGHLADFVKLEKGEIPREVPDDRAWMFLHAYLMQQIYADIFERPFFAFGERYPKVRKLESPEGYTYIVQDLIERLSNEFTYNDLRESFAWRVQTLRLLSPPLHDDEDPEKSRIQATRRATEDARIEAARDLCRTYLDSGVNVLLQNISPESKKL